MDDCYIWHVPAWSRTQIADAIAQLEKVQRPAITELRGAWLGPGEVELYVFEDGRSIYAWQALRDLRARPVLMLPAHPIWFHERALRLWVDGRRALVVRMRTVGEATTQRPAWRTAVASAAPNGGEGLGLLEGIDV